MNHKLGRNQSWNILYDLTKEYIDGKRKDLEFYTLNLSMYLASWGMYRGSTKLLQHFNFKILNPITEIILNEKYHELYYLYSLEEFSNKKDLILSLYVEIKEGLEEIFKKSKPLKRKRDGKEEEVKTSGVTTTLITKIMLGSYGCIVAYDNFVSKELSLIGIQVNIKKKEQLEKSLNQTIKTLEEIKFTPKSIDGVKYPLMKNFDMALFGLQIIKKVK